MDNNFKRIVDSEIAYYDPQFKNIFNEITSEYPMQGKGKILLFFKRNNKFKYYGMFQPKDPITGKSIGELQDVFEKDGFHWTALDVYMFKKYNIKLTDEFVNYVLSGQGDKD